MKKLSILAMIALTGCALNANFDRYQNQSDEGLFGSIIGLPIGDTIDEPLADAFVVDDSEIGGKALRISDIATFRPANHSRPDIYTVSWRGHMVSGDGTTTIEIRGRDDRVAVGAVIEANRFTFVTSEPANSPLSFSLPSGAHDVRIEIAKGVTNNVDLSISFAGGGGEQFLNLAPVDSGFDAIESIEVLSVGGASYALDDLFVGLGR